MFDFVGDIHGCIEELRALLAKLGYTETAIVGWRHPDGRKLVFVGDLNDRGPDSAAVLALVRGLVRNGCAMAVRGNHDDKLGRALNGNDVKRSHGLDKTMEQLEALPDAERQGIKEFVDSLPIELQLDGGKVSCSHAGLPTELQGKTNGKAKSHALFGKTTGKMDAEGLPERLDWAQDYAGERIVIHGHTPMKEVRCVNNVWCIDTGAPFGNKLTALRYPEMVVVDVPSAKNYAGFDKKLD